MAQTKIAYPFFIKVIRFLFPILESIAPSVAVKWAVKLFLTPFQFGFTPTEKQHLDKFKMHDVIISRFKIRTYEIGEGPLIICVHGWAGRGMQFYKMAIDLADAGYKLLLIDAPAHGMSEGKMSNLFEYTEVFIGLKEKQDNLVAVIGHSLGAASISLAISEGSKVPAFISLAAPVVAQDILDEFANRLNVNKTTIHGMRKKAVTTFSRTFDSVTMETTFKVVDCPVLAIHGSNDFDVPIYHLDVLKKIKPETEIRRIEGIGHRRILKDERVIKEIKNWLLTLK